MRSSQLSDDHFQNFVRGVILSKYNMLQGNTNYQLILVSNPVSETYYYPVIIGASLSIIYLDYRYVDVMFKRRNEYYSDNSPLRYFPTRKLKIQV